MTTFHQTHPSASWLKKFAASPPRKVPATLEICLNTSPSKKRNSLKSDISDAAVSVTSILKFQDGPTLKSLAYRDWMHPRNVPACFRALTRRCRISRRRSIKILVAEEYIKDETEEFRVEDITFGGLEAEDDSSRGKDAKFGSSVGEYKDKVEGHSVLDDHADPRRPVDEFSIEGTKVGHSTVDSFKAEGDSESDTSDEEALTGVHDSVADTSGKSPPGSLGSLERLSSTESLEVEDAYPTEIPHTSINDLPTEILQLIFMELPTLDDAKGINATSRRMRAVFKEYEHGITWAILSRELGPLLSGTLGALAIYASKRKGVFDEPLLGNMGISTRYWGKMLREHGEKAKKLLTPTRADHMLHVYRRFPRMIPCGPVGAKCCSACRSSALAEADWDPMTDSSNGSCMQHLLQANAVRWRLNCRMAMDFTQLSEVLEDFPHEKWDWEPQPIVRKIMRRVEFNPDEESELEVDIAQDDNIDSEHQLELDNDSTYGVEPGVDDRVAIVQLDNISLETKVRSEDAVFHGEQMRKKDKVQSEDEIENKENDDPGGELQRIDQPPTQSKVFPKKRLHQEVEVYQEAEIYPAKKIRQEIALVEQEKKEIELWFRSDEANALLRA